MNEQLLKMQLPKENPLENIRKTLEGGHLSGSACPIPHPPFPSEPERFNKHASVGEVRQFEAF